MKRTVSLLLLMASIAQGQALQTYQMRFVDEFGRIASLNDSVSIYVYRSGTTSTITIYRPYSGRSFICQQPITKTSTNSPLYGNADTLMFSTAWGSCKVVITDGACTRTIDNLASDRAVQVMWPTFGPDWLENVQLDDTAGNGDTTLLWSADKIYDELVLKQGLDAQLTALAGLSPNADQVVYWTGLTSPSLTSLTSWARSWIAHANDIEALADLETSINILLETEIDGSSELAALMDDETGTGALVFGTDPALTDANLVTATLTDPTISDANMTTVTISSGTITGITDLAVADGGTGASTAGGARTNLGLVIGADVEAHDPNLTGFAAVDPNNLDMPYWQTPGTLSSTPMGVFGRSRLADANQTERLTALNRDSIFDVSDERFGAQIDGITDDYNAVSAAFTAAATIGGTVYFPPGACLIGSNVTGANNVCVQFAPGAYLTGSGSPTFTVSPPGHLVGTPAGRIVDIDTCTLVAMDSEGRISPRWFGAVGDNATDDTDAVQAAIDCQEALYSANSDTALPYVYVNPGRYLCSNLTLPAATVIIGAQMKAPIFYVKTGTTGDFITDEGSAQGIWLKNFQVYGHSGADCNGIKLGYNGLQHGGMAGLENILVRECDPYGIMVNGNAAFYSNIECHETLRINGTGNLWSNVIQTGTDANGIDVKGLANVISNVHLEGAYSNAAIYVDQDNNQFINITRTIDSSDQNESPTIKIASAEYGVVCQNISTYCESGAAAPNSIEDYCYGTRIHPGYTGPTSDYLFVPFYVSGRERAYAQGLSSGPPTTGTWRPGDMACNREAVAGEPTDYICIVAGSPGTWAPVNVIPGAIAKTSDYAVQAADTGKRFSNAGASSVVTFTLCPDAIGQRFEFHRINATYALRIDPNDGTDTIIGGGAGKYLELDTDGDLVALVRGAANTWYFELIVDPNGADAPFDFES